MASVPVLQTWTVLGFDPGKVNLGVVLVQSNAGFAFSDDVLIRMGGETPTAYRSRLQRYWLTHQGWSILEWTALNCTIDVSAEVGDSDGACDTCTGDTDVGDTAAVADEDACTAKVRRYHEAMQWLDRTWFTAHERPRDGTTTTLVFEIQDNINAETRCMSMAMQMYFRCSWTAPCIIGKAGSYKLRVATVLGVTPDVVAVAKAQKRANAAAKATAKVAAKAAAAAKRQAKADAQAKARAALASFFTGSGLAQRTTPAAATSLITPFMGGLGTTAAAAFPAAVLDSSVKGGDAGSAARPAKAHGNRKDQSKYTVEHVLVPDGHPWRHVYMTVNKAKRDDLADALLMSLGVLWDSISAAIPLPAAQRKTKALVEGKARGGGDASTRKRQRTKFAVAPAPALDTVREEDEEDVVEVF